MAIVGPRMPGIGNQYNESQCHLAIYVSGQRSRQPAQSAYEPPETAICEGHTSHTRRECVDVSHEGTHLSKWMITVCIPGDQLYPKTHGVNNLLR